MKKYMVVCAGLCAMMALTGCKSSESAYKKAYEKAKAQEAAQQVAPQEQTDTYTAAQETPVVAPIVEKPANEVRVVDNADNVQVRQEKVSVIDGSGLKNFSVVVGSFSLKANADGLQQRLKDKGYAAQVVKNDDRNMYRVVATTFDSKAEAAASRNEFRSTYPDAWLLYNVR